MKTKLQDRRNFIQAASIAVILTARLSSSAQVQLLDDFNSGNITVTNSVNSSFGNAVPGVFGGNRTVLMTKELETSATSLTIGSGVLTWSETGRDYASVSYGTASTSFDLSSYDRFRITVVSAPESAGRLQIDLSYYGAPNSVYGTYALATLPAAGTVEIPFSSFRTNAGFPTIDFTGIHGVGLTFQGNLLAQGTYVLDDFQMVASPGGPSQYLSVTNFVGPGYGTNDGVTAAARFYSPDGLAVDGNGTIYVADSLNYTIRRISPAGEVTTFAGIPGSAGAVDGPSNLAAFQWPRDVAVDNAGNVYVADAGNHAIRKITPDGNVSTLAGQLGVPGSANGQGGAASFRLPSSLVLDKQGILYVADSGNNTIRKVTLQGEVSTLAGLAGSNPEVRDGTGGDARFGYPLGMAVNGAGELFVGDSGSVIRKITAGGIVTSFAGWAGHSGLLDGVGAVARLRPYRLAVDHSDNLYVTTDRTVVRIAPDASATTVAGWPSAPAQLTNGIGNFARFGSASGVAVSQDGSIYIADRYFHVVRKAEPYVGTLPGEDPDTWKWERPLPLNDRFSFVCYEGGRFLAFGQDAAASSDGINWTVLRTGLGLNFYSLAAAAGKLVAVTDSGFILASTNAVDWYAPVNPPNQMFGVAFGKGEFVAIGNGGFILTSPDAATWQIQQVNYGGFNKFRGVAFANGQFGAVSLRSGAITSTDGFQWKQVLSGVQLFNTSVSANNRFFLAQDDGAGGGRCLTTTNFVDFDGGINDALFGSTVPHVPFVVYAGTQFYVAGEKMYSSTKPPIGDFVAHDSILPAHFGLAYHNGVIVTSYGEIFVRRLPGLFVPSLSVVADSADIVLSWTTSGTATNYVVESNPNLSSGFWAPILDKPQATVNNWSLRLPLNQPARFFRLKGATTP